MKLMPIEFEPTASFCYKFSRYHLLQEIANEPEALSGEPFNLTTITTRLIHQYLTDQQLEMTYLARDTGQSRQVGAQLKFYVGFRAKRGSESPFVWLGNSGMYRLKSESDIRLEVVEDEDQIAEDDVELEINGWIYAFTFPLIKQDAGPYPIKIGLTTAADVETRVNGQCRGSGFFEMPEILDRWQVRRVAQVEAAVHSVLKARGRWKEDAPGDEWFNTTIEEIRTIISFINR
jgi:hypothetical protein